MEITDFLNYIAASFSVDEIPNALDYVIDFLHYLLRG